ncbi:hypothetical protein AB0957_34580 [Streptomyces zhihengii]|uniref:hypothetical protein n=1 Tax=Streptomyces zhihengii TaxID=1818004 RepID=UPI003454526B
MYRALHRTLVGELGVDPGPAVREAHAERPSAGGAGGWSDDERTCVGESSPVRSRPSGGGARTRTGRPGCSNSGECHAHDSVGWTPCAHVVPRR